VIIAGDFNTDVEKEKIDLPRCSTHGTDKSFPHPVFLERLHGSNQFLPRISRNFLKLGNGQRSLDHIIATDPFCISGCQAIETVSDHLAVIADIEEKD
jgi:endonuclease/exonuclease/phosphatase family metal-dependent hydrolase